MSTFRQRSIGLDTDLFQGVSPRAAVRAGITRIEIIAAIVAVTVLACLTVVAGPQGSYNKSIAKLFKIGMVTGAYQLDNRNTLPITLSPPPSGTSSWCTWSYGGKNCNAYWVSQFGGVFDCQARFRPLNAYMYPGRVWKNAASTSPTGPRYLDQAAEFRDPSDLYGYQQNWPNRNTTLSSYDDVGASYLMSVAWWDQVSGERPGASFAQLMAEGNRRIAATERLNPARFVWNADSTLDVVVFSTNRALRFRNGWGHINQSCVLYLDGHASYVPAVPGNAADTLNNANYDLIFTTP